MRRSTLFSSKQLHYNRFYLVPLLAFMFILVLLGVTVYDQRESELTGIRERLQLQTSLLSEKISSKLNTYEMTLETIGLRASALDLDTEEGRETLGIAVRQQLFLHTEIEGVCLITTEGEKLFTSFSPDFPALEETRLAMLDAHLIRRIPFAQFVYIDHGARHLVFSRSLTDRDRELKAIAALVIETDRFFDLLTQAALPGVEGAVLYDAEGVIFASWLLDVSSLEKPFVAYGNIDELPGYADFALLVEDQSQLVGGERTVELGSRIVALTQTANFPLTLGVHLSVPDALASFDRTMRISLIVIIILMGSSMFIVHLLVVQTRQKDRLQLQMVEELSIQVQQRTSELEHLSSYDTLTQIMNRRKFSEELEHAIENHRSRKETCSIVCIDLDGFKKVNDSWGHVVGDQVLIHITTIIRDRVGDHGIVGRWGGDELIILYRNCDERRAFSLADGVREQVDLTPFQSDIHCTVSMGVAEHRVGESSVELIRRADNAMYQAKAAGKNRVNTASTDH